MTVVTLPSRSDPARIRDERVRAAARRFEAETGERLADTFARLEDPLVELFLILRGYPAD